MPGPAQVQFPIVRQDRHARDHIEGHKGFRADEINLADVFRGSDEAAQVRTQELREFHQDTGDFALFVELQFADLVLQLHDFERLDEGRLAGSRFVIDDAGQLFLAARRDRDQHSSVPHHHFRFGIDQSLALGLGEDAADPAGHLPLFGAEGPADFAQLGRSRIAHLAVAVEDRLDAPPDLGLVAHRRGNLPERGIQVVLALAEKGQDAAKGVEAGAQDAHRRQVDARVLGLQGQQEGFRVVIAAGREAVFKQADQAHLVGQPEPEHDLAAVVRDLLRGHLARRILRGALGRDLLANLVKADFLFQHHPDATLLFV